MRTIPRHYPRDKMAGDYKATCVHCGGSYYRRDMKRDADGKLTCLEAGCGDGGRTSGQLDRAKQRRMLRNAGTGVTKRGVGW